MTAALIDGNAVAAALRACVTAAVRDLADNHGIGPFSRGHALRPL